jgi:MAF protein
MFAPREVLLILASASPRRRELIGLTGLSFEVRVAGIDETPRDGETPGDYVRRVAREKAKENPKLVVSEAEPSQLPNPNKKGGRELIVAADTAVVIDGEILGKPRDREDAAAMLRKLRGRTHEVLSAIALVDVRDGQLREEFCRSEVTMRNYSDDEIADYAASGDPLDKAGAYAIQHNGFRPVEKFAHCYASVMGMPLCHFTRVLRSMGIEPPADVPMACQRFNSYQCPVYREILGDDSDNG